MTDDHDKQLAPRASTPRPRSSSAPVQSDPAAIERLVQFAAFSEGGRVLDAGCGPGLVSIGLFDAGLSALGVDLSKEKIERARKRCDAHTEKQNAGFEQASVYDTLLDHFAPFDGALSRFVLHHVLDPFAFLQRQVALAKEWRRHRRLRDRPPLEEMRTQLRRHSA